MRKLTGLIFASLMIMCGLAIDSSAQSRKPWSGVNESRPRNINQRQQRQQKRVISGIKSGELTARETYRLQREQYQIRRLESRFRRSGDGLSQRERARLRREQNQASRHIYRQKHDRQDYPNYPR